MGSPGNGEPQLRQARGRCQEFLLPEAGGDFVNYFADNDLEEFVVAVELLLQPEYREKSAQRIRDEYVPLGWDAIAQAISSEIDDARHNHREFMASLHIGREYGLGSIATYREGFYEGDKVIRFLDRERRLPLTQQLIDVERELTAEMVLPVGVLPPERGGRPVSPNAALVLEFPRPVGGELFSSAVLATRQTAAD